MSPNDEANREAAARSFFNETDTNARQQEILYRWLLGTAPPDNSVLTRLESGYSTESPIVYLVAGNEFFSQSNNDNKIFVENAYARLLDRQPTSWELDSAVNDLNGYWLWVEDECEQTLCTVDGICMPADSSDPNCGHWEWYQLTREDFAWDIVWSYEFRQVAAGYFFGIQMRRVATDTEINDHAVFLGAYGLKEGALRLAKSSEFFEKSTKPW